MKKMLIAFIMVLFLTGCNNDLMNTPTKRVETMLNNYVTLDEAVVDDLDNTLLEETVMTNDQKSRYKDILKRQYQNLSYEIKDEIIDGDTATVEVEIEVYDYRKIIDAADDYLNNNAANISDETLKNGIFVKNIGSNIKLYDHIWANIK